MSRIILHIDLNTFFVRVEEIKDPSLIGKPVAIGNEGRGGIVSTCSYEARKYGVSSGMPMFKAKELCKNLIIKDVDWKEINLMSNEFFSYLRNYSSKIEILGCDECYMDITEEYQKLKDKNIMNYARKIQYGLLKKTKLKCSIGIGPTKFLAKMGSDYKKPMGITIIRKKDIQEMLFPLDIKAFYGIGKQTQKRLYRVNINTIGELYKVCKENPLEDDIFTSNFKEYVISCLEGRTSDKLETIDFDPKSIGTTRTLSHNTNEKDEIKAFYLQEVDRIIAKLKSENKLCKTITITYKDAQLIDDKFESTQHSKTLKEYTDNNEVIRKAAISLFESTFKNQTIRLIGFTVKNLIDKYEAVTQMTFSDYMIHEKENETFLLINDLNRDFKREVLFRASDLKNKKKNGN